MAIFKKNCDVHTLIMEQIEDVEKVLLAFEGFFTGARIAAIIGGVAIAVGCRCGHRCGSCQRCEERTLRRSEECRNCVAFLPDRCRSSCVPRRSCNQGLLRVID